MSKIYLVRETGGEWEDSWEQIIKAFKNKEDAENFVNEKVSYRKYMLSFSDFWDEIENKMSESTPEEWYEYDYDGDQWDDSHETFIKYLKEWHPEYLINYTEDKLIELFEFYIHYDEYYDSSSFYIDEIELE